MITLEFDGTSHGEGYRGVIKGLPKGYKIDAEEVDNMLRLRKRGYGRSARQYEKPDAAQLGGLNKGKTDGEISFFVADAFKETRGEITAPRPSHADLAAYVKYGGKKGIRELSEGYSARSSVGYVVCGSVCKQILEEYGVYTYSYTYEIGGVTADKPYVFRKELRDRFGILNCPDHGAEKLMAEKIDLARESGDSLGGITLVCAEGVPMGAAGDFFPYSSRLDGKIAGLFMSIPSVKGVEIGERSEFFASGGGRECSDSLVFDGCGIVYSTNRCGGITGGISTGGKIKAYLTVKPVPTVKGVNTVDIITKKVVPQLYERADVCVVPNVGIIAECMLAECILNELIIGGFVTDKP